MPSFASYAGQIVIYGAAALFTGYFSINPVYQQVPEGQAQIKLVINHGGKRIDECRKLTVEELSKLPTNQRRPSNCSRERSPLDIVLTVDGKSIYEAVLPPAGLSKDGPAKAYQKFLVDAGPHVIEVKLRDSVRSEEYAYKARHEAVLEPWQNLAIDFDSEVGGFIFR